MGHLGAVGVGGGWLLLLLFIVLLLLLLLLFTTAVLCFLNGISLFALLENAFYISL